MLREDCKDGWLRGEWSPAGTDKKPEMPTLLWELGPFLPSVGSSDQTMEAATQCPPYAVPGSEVGPAHLGTALHFLSKKSHTYQFSPAEKYSEGILGWTGDGPVWTVTG